MQHSIELIKLTERLQERCQCFDCNDGATMQGYMSSFLNVLARLFCWVDSECDTILKALRQEVIELDKVELCACQAIFEFKPFYFKGFDPSTLRIYVQSRQGAKREQCELRPDQYDYSFVDGTVLVNLTDILQPCCRCEDPCECPTTYKLIATYEAGYTADTMPDCVLDSMCHFLNIFIAYQNSCGSIEECANMDRLAVGAVLKKKSVDYIVREWTVDKMSRERMYMTLINKWSMATLSSLSLCQATAVTDNMFIAIGRRKEC